MKKYFLCIITVLFFLTNLSAQVNVLKRNFDGNLSKDEITRSYVNPARVVWKSTDDDKYIKDPENLLKQFDGQLSTGEDILCTMYSTEAVQASVLLDFGKELYGGIEIATAIRDNKKPIKIRVRLGESVTEAMSDIGGQTPGTSATNDHSLRDFTINTPWLGTVEIGNSGFRFVRIDLLETDVALPLRAVRASFRYRDIPYLGSFKCDDDRLNQIWETGAYTVHLNMQDYLWDGIKRDRLVWVGDLHPEVKAISAVFGENEVINKSLDFARNTTPLPGWMNGISSYSLWWIIIQRDLYLYQGNLSYLKEQKVYLEKLVHQIISKVDNGREALDGQRFLDWPTADNKDAIDMGLQSMVVLALDASKDMANWLNDIPLKNLCEQTLKQLHTYRPDAYNNKQAASLLSLADLVPTDKAADVILKDGANDFATFYGYYMLEALAKSGRYEEAMKIISDYWGAMLDLGATTFWEDFVYAEKDNAGRIDELVPESKHDIHADGGKHCYVGLRASLCHGWASGPTAWLTEHVLGVKVLAPGSKVIKIEPNLGNLKFVEGTFPTPQGVVYIKHEKQADGKLKTKVKAPKGVTVRR